MKQPVYLLAVSPGHSRGGTAVILNKIILSSGISKPCVAYVGSASNDSFVFFKMISSILKKAGAGDVILAKTASEKADISKTKKILLDADMIFISGGDVEAGMKVLEERGLISFLRELRKIGTLFIGISAGSIMLGQKWVRWQDENDDSPAEEFPCLGIAPVICDTHGESEGWAELKTLLSIMGNGTKGYGITSDCGLSVWPDGRVESMGGEVDSFLNLNGKIIER
jgi:peptidase E